MINNEDAVKIKVQRCIVSISILLLIGKFIAFFMTNSVGIFTDAMESIVNVIAGFISLYSIYVSSKPKDEGHPFGHGKVELISASLEGLLIIGAGLIIVYEGVVRLFEPSSIEKLDVGIIIITIAGLVNYIMGVVSIRVGKRYESIALVAGGKHLQSDTYSTIGLVIGLILLYFTKIAWIDSALAIIFGSIIIVTGVLILNKTIANLMDKADSKVLETMTRSIAENRADDWIDIHNLKTIRYGSFLYIDCDLTLPWYYNIMEGHDACDRLRDTMADGFAGKVIVSIHSDPCKPQAQCHCCKMVNCGHRTASCTTTLELTLRELTQSDEQRKASLDSQQTKL